jgi:hypothetical protein
MKRWQDDAPFCDWLLQVKYARKQDDTTIVPSLSNGAVIYMWESFRAGSDLSLVATTELLSAIALEIDERNRVRTECGESRMAPSTSSDVSAAIRVVVGALPSIRPEI